MKNSSSSAQKNLSEEDSSGSEPETDRFGFILTNGSTAGSVGPSPELVRQREAKWIKIIEQWDRILSKKSSKVKVQCQKGIPASLRARCWPLLCGAANRMKQQGNLYKTLDGQLALQSWVDVIERDLDRQFPFHEMFQAKDGHGQRGLFRVLKAYTQYQPDDGYCQAQGPVAAVLLMNMPAEEAFWCLVQISEQYLPGYYSPLLEGVLFDAAMLTWVLKKTCPAAHKHLQNHGVEPLMFATDWLMCLFTRHLPFNTLVRVWDLFFCYGVRVLLQVAAVLVRRVLGRAEQRKQCQGQMETLERLRGVKEQVLEEDDEFIAEVCSVPLSGKDLEKQTEKELEKWRKDRPSSTFDPRGRCHGYRMAWARAQQNEMERERKEREKGNLSVPLTRSASSLSLSPSILHKKWKKGGKTSTGDSQGSNKVVRHLSMGAREDWKSWNEFDFNKVQGVKEEEDVVSEGHKEEQTEQKALSQTPEKMEHTKNILMEETIAVKEQSENGETRIAEKEEVSVGEKEASKTGEMGECKAGETEENKAREMAENKLSEMEENKAGETEENMAGEMEESKLSEMEENKAGEMAESKLSEMEENKTGETEEKMARETEESKAGETEKNEAREMVESKLSEMEENKVGEVEEKMAGEVEEKMAGGVEEKTARETEESKAGKTEESKAGEMEKNKAGEMEENKAREVAESKLSEMEENKVGETEEKMAGEMEESKAGETEKNEAREMVESKLSEMEENKVGEVEEKMAGEVEEKTAREMEESKAGKTEESKAGEMEKNKAGEMEENKAREVAESKLSEMEENKVGETEEKMARETEESKDGETAESKLSEMEENKAGETEEKMARETEESKDGETEEKMARETEESKLSEMEENKAGETEENMAREMEERMAGEMEESNAGETEESNAGETEENMAGETAENKAEEMAENKAGETEENKAGETEENMAGEMEESKMLSEPKQETNIGVNLGEEHIIQVDMKSDESTETDVQQVEMDTKFPESKSETSVETDRGVEALTAEDQNAAIETETEQEELIMETKGALDIKYHSTESIVETEKEVEFHTQKQTETEVLTQIQENPATKEDLKAKITEANLEEHIDSRTETEEDALILPLSQCTQQKGTGAVDDAETETEITVEKDTTEGSSEATEEIILNVHSDAQVESDSCICAQKITKETQRETQTDEKTADSATPTETEETSASADELNHATEPDENSSVQISSSKTQAPEQPTSQVTVCPKDSNQNLQQMDPMQEEEMTERCTGEDNVFISSEPTNLPQVQCSQSAKEPPVKTPERRSSRSSGDFCVRKSTTSHSSRLARRLSEDLFTTPQKTSENPPEAKHAESQCNSEAMTQKDTAPDAMLSAAATEEAPAQQQPHPDPPKRFGLFRRLRGEQHKDTKAKKATKMQVPKILIQDFSDMTGTGNPVEEVVEEKLTSKERRRLRREQERMEKEEERLKKKREKELEKEKEKEKERRKPKTRGKSFQGQKQKGSDDAAHLAKTGSQTLRYSAPHAESYF